MSKYSDQKRRERRAARNRHLKIRAEKAFLNRWPRERLLSFGRPCRYTSIARYYRLRKENRDRLSQVRPRQVLEAVERPLANFQKASRGEPIDGYEWEDENYRDIVKFWRYWLREVWTATHRPLDDFGEPVLRLRQLLEDLSEGRTTSLTGLLPIKSARKGKGRRDDPVPVIRYKLALGLCYRLLMVVSLRKQPNALWKLRAIMARLGYKKKPQKRDDLINSEIPALARKLLSKKYIEQSALFPKYFETDHLIRDFMFNYYNQLRYDFLVTDNIEAVFQHFYRREVPWSEKEWAEEVAGFRRAMAAKGEPSLKRRFAKAWLRAEDITCSVILWFTSDCSELRRFGIST